ncbi:MAG TPA: amidohydrolase family protein [Planctomycetota bacterium]|nr:amidohydrolase family protein [Planctomycetota bacterium]
MHQSDPGARNSRARRFRLAAALSAGLCVSSGLAHARADDPKPSQAKDPAAAVEKPAPPKAEVIVIRAGKLIVKPGQVLEGVSVLIEDGLITQVGKIVTAPAGAREIKGAVVCAGFIDPWSVYGVDSESVGDQRNSPSAATADALDDYIDPRLRKDVLRAGITTVRTQMGVLARVSGTGTVVRLHPELPLEKTKLANESCLSMTLGVRADGNGSDPFERLSDVERLAGMITQGEAYAVDQVEYQHELTDWKKKIADKQKELEEGFKKAKKDREKELAESKEKGKEFKEKEFKEDKPPKAPKLDPDKAVLARVAEGEIPLIVEVHRASQLRALLAATEQFKRLRLVLAGATDAMEVAPELVRRHIPVVVWPQPVGANPRLEMERFDLGLAGQLEEAGVTVLLGSGARSPSGSRDLPLLAELAIGHGLDREAAFSALTIGAARALDLGSRLGSVERGKDADLLVLDGDPLAGATHIEYVISGGDVVITPEDR